MERQTDMSKRASGEGSVRQRPNGLWEARLSYVDPDRAAPVGVVLRPTAEAARDELTRPATVLQTQAPVLDSTMRLADWIEHWSDTALEASPQARHQGAVSRPGAQASVRADVGHLPLARLRKSHVDGLVVTLRRAGLADTTVRQAYTVLRAVLADAGLDGLIAHNAAAKTPRPRWPAARPGTCRPTTRQMLAAAEQ